MTMAGYVLQIRVRLAEYFYDDTRQSHCIAAAAQCRFPAGALVLLAFDDVVCLLLFASEAFLWRGVWNLNATFMISDLFLGGWVNHAAGTVILTALQLFSYVGICGCARDHDSPPEEGASLTVFLTIYATPNPAYRERPQKQATTNLSKKFIKSNYSLPIRSDIFVSN